MNKSLPVAVGFALILAACAHGPQFRDFGVTTGSVANASVQVVGDLVIVVSQEPIFVQQGEDNTIYWSLPAGGAYFFPNTAQNPGIKFDNPPPARLQCDLNNHDKYTYVCTYKRANRGKYPYTIRVTKNGTDILKSDPTVMNN
jgi:hypothetical protein